VVVVVAAVAVAAVVVAAAAAATVVVVMMMMMMSGVMYPNLFFSSNFIDISYLLLVTVHFSIRAKYIGK
jgi:hypothetical protein